MRNDRTKNKKKMLKINIFFIETTCFYDGWRLIFTIVSKQTTVDFQINSENSAIFFG